MERKHDALKTAATRGDLPLVVFHSDHASVRGFQWSSQHLDDGGVLRWQNSDSSRQIERSGRPCGLRGAAASAGGRTRVLAAHR